jgi:hypothetical protein
VTDKGRILSISHQVNVGNSILDWVQSMKAWVLRIRFSVSTPYENDRLGRYGLVPSKMNEDKRQLDILFI